jgi:hypothetical protein
MNLDGIIKELKQERARIDNALSALEQLTPGISKAARVQAIAPSVAGKNRRKMSPAARKAIGDAQRKRWAKQRKVT